jgi:hypothetical protein
MLERADQLSLLEPRQRRDARALERRQLLAAPVRVHPINQHVIIPRTGAIHIRPSNLAGRLLLSQKGERGSDRSKKSDGFHNIGLASIVQRWATESTVQILSLFE